MFDAQTSARKWGARSPSVAPFGVSPNASLACLASLRLRVNPVFKIKKTSQNVQRIGKVMQGKAMVFAPPRGVPPIILPKPSAKERKSPYFHGFYPFFSVKRMSFFTPKNLRFMAFFLQFQIVNQSKMMATERIGGHRLSAMPSPAGGRWRCHKDLPIAA
jgi:hypothetical protein